MTPSKPEDRSAEPSPVEPRLFLEAEMEAPVEIPLAGGAAVVFSCRSPFRASANEDAAAVVPLGPAAGLLVVADGLGGEAAGGRAAELAVSTLAVAAGAAASEGSALRNAILDGLEEADRQVQALDVGAGTTVAAVEVGEAGIRPYNVGDSTILVVAPEGYLRWRSVAHSPVGFAVEAGVLDEREAISHEDRHLLLNVLGSPEMWIEIGPRLHLAPGETLLLASDGLTDNLHLQEVVDELAQGPLLEAVTRMTETARRRMGNRTEREPSKPDDLTLVAYRR